MIFLDATYLIGVILKNDTHTSKSLELKSIIKNERKLINNTVFNEVLNSVSTTNCEYDADSLIELLLSYNIDFLTKEDYIKSFDKFKYYNYAINYSDCTILQTMEDYKINTIVSFDSDFDKIQGINRIYL